MTSFTLLCESMELNKPWKVVKLLTLPGPERHNLAWKEPNGSSMDGGTRSPFNRVSLYSMSFANSMYSAKNDVHSFSFDLNSRLSDNLFNQFLTAFSKQTDPIRDSKSAEFPFIDIQDGTGTNTQYMALGYELFTWNNAVNNTVFNMKDDITYYLNNHKIMGGISYEYQMADNQYMRSGTGYYRYLSVDDFINRSEEHTSELQSLY